MNAECKMQNHSAFSILHSERTRDLTFDRASARDDRPYAVAVNREPTTDFYDTLASPAECQIKIERSRFLALAFPVRSDVELNEHLAAITKKHFKATHHCWAYRLHGEGQVRTRSSDAGEPSGTAGKPILSAIEGAELYDTAVVVVRWFGGVKLGTGGLARAYRQAAVTVLSHAPRKREILYQRFEISVSFAATGALFRLLAAPDVVLVSEQYGEENIFVMDVRRSMADRIAKLLTEQRLSFRIQN